MALKRADNRMKKILRELQAKNEPVALFGAALCGERYLEILRDNGITVAFFADDDVEKQAKGVAGLPVVPTERLSSWGGQIIIASYGPEKIVKRLKKMDANLIPRLVQPDFYLWEQGLDYFSYYNEHREEIEAADALLADTKSHRVFHNLLQYKISRNPELIETIRDDVRLQYFDPEIIHFGREEIFLDLGAYDGDTVEAFANISKEQYSKIIALEPDARNFDKLQTRAKQFRDVECYSCGVGAKDGKARFSASADWTSTFNDIGEIEVEIRIVDSLMAGRRLTFLKADIEGLEKEMLAGASGIIAEQAPQMAIAVYHCKEDLFRIINIIHSYYNGYAFYLRHYTEMPIDTVLYAVRQNGDC